MRSAADDQAMAQQVAQLLIGPLKPGTAVLSVLGTKRWQQGVQALCDLLGSATFMLQVRMPIKAAS